MALTVADSKVETCYQRKLMVVISFHTILEALANNTIFASRSCVVACFNFTYALLKNHNLVSATTWLSYIVMLDSSPNQTLFINTCRSVNFLPYNRLVQISKLY